MAFNTSSVLAGVGTVVVVLSTGFAGGYMIANPNHVQPPNRLQRVAAADLDAKAAMPAAVTAPAAPQVVAIATQPSPPVQAPVPQPTVAQISDRPEVKADAQPPVEASASAISEKSKPKMATAQTMSTDRSSVDRAGDTDARNSDNRTAESRAADRKRIEPRKFAEQQRKQREIEVATIAVRRIIHERDAQDVVDDDQPEAPAPTAPHFSLFGQD